MSAVIVRIPKCERLERRFQDTTNATRWPVAELGIQVTEVANALRAMKCTQDLWHVACRCQLFPRSLTSILGSLGIDNLEHLRHLETASSRLPERINGSGEVFEGFPAWVELL